MLIMIGFAAAFVTDRLGVEYLLGAFLAGLVARLLENRVPQLASHDNLRSVKLFSSFFLPFYFFARGAHVPADALSLQALVIGVGLTVTLVPLRAFSIWAKRRHARHRQRAQQPAGGRGTDAHPDLHTGVGGHPARARRHLRRVVWRPAAVCGPQHPAAVFRAAHGVRCRAHTGARCRRAKNSRHRRATTTSPSRRPDFRPPRRPPCAIRR